MTANIKPLDQLPDWVPSAVRLYLTHTEGGRSLRDIAREEGVHASTVLRQVRRFENRRDDPLVDGALGRLRQSDTTPEAANAKGSPMPQGEDALDAEARRLLPRLAEAGALLVVAPDMARAVVLREGPSGTSRLAVLDRPVAEAFALREWIACQQSGRVLRYEITGAGRATLRRLLGEAEPPVRRAAVGMDEEDQRRTRPVTIESPITALARRRDRDGQPFLTPDLVHAAERLREDFEAAQAGPRVTQDWERFLSGPSRGAGGRAAPIPGASAARDRVAAALRELGPGLADMALRCCCYMEGLETAERRLGWSASSGKIVLRIALLRLKRHYDDLGEEGMMIG
ncbi:DUF6456 domain-containing protein [Pararhodobacter sp. CCB-MM2]|uniref:DUF6456 domain-containing protein n=1 Tax=Pararhodobacter sp. CCB-MM2 TaxID=1786003 RepID=UPI0008323FF3|nr:DUF6456 domain-containing protein [Pararhodobacter sp. CCB-MM2]